MLFISWEKEEQKKKHSIFSQTIETTKQCDELKIINFFLFFLGSSRVTDKLSKHLARETQEREEEKYNMNLLFCKWARRCTRAQDYIIHDTCGAQTV